MAAWEEIVAAMAQLTPQQISSTWPLTTNEIAPPGLFDWGEDLPPCEALQRFYSLCDGGVFGNCAYTIHSAEEILSQSDYWFGMLEEAGMIAGRHFVFGADASGSPLLWDVVTNQVVIFWCDGGDW